MKVNRYAQQYLHALNELSSKQHINYALTYQYRYYEKSHIFKCNISIEKFIKKKFTHKYIFKDSISLFEFIDQEYKKYS